MSSSKSAVEPKIRRAEWTDVNAMFEARQRSIYGLCGDDYSEEQMRVWSEFDPSEDRARSFIEDGPAWLVELNGVVEGMAQFRPEGVIHFLYLSPKISGQGFGKELMGLMEEEARGLGLKKLCLRSSLTALRFYESCGFVKCGAQKEACISGTNLTCIDMEKSLA